MKYILVTGGVISSVGKGVIASSIGKILKSYGREVTAIKIDPYFNVDAGNFSPCEHGEVFVLDDGTEVDLDLGNYERFLDIKLHRDNNITSGKIYQLVISQERRGDYLGKTVQTIPHVTNAIQEWIERVAIVPVSESAVPEICIIELGGTIGDMDSMPFVEALRQLQFKVKKENFCVVHVSLILEPKATGEPKTKPTKTSIQQLLALGLSPDVIVCRSEKPLTDDIKNKVSSSCLVPRKQVIGLHDAKSVYHVPMFLERQGLGTFFQDRLNMPVKRSQHTSTLKWRRLTNIINTVSTGVDIALVGKYTVLPDAYTSVTKALEHASLYCNLKLNLKFIAAADLELATEKTNPVKYYAAWSNLCKASGVLIPGGFGQTGIEGKIAAIKWARKNQKPFLGICLGFQCAVIEFARNVLKLRGAHSVEMDKDTPHKVVIDMPEHNTGQMGGTMRLGRKTTVFKTEDSIMYRLYGNCKEIEERHRHRYEVNKEYVPQLEASGLTFVGHDLTKERLEVLELKDHPFFAGVQYHPEYISRPLVPSPPYLGFILAASGKLKSYLTKGCQLSPRTYYEDDFTSDEETHSSAKENSGAEGINPTPERTSSSPEIVNAEEI